MFHQSHLLSSSGKDRSSKYEGVFFAKANITNGGRKYVLTERHVLLAIMISKKKPPSPMLVRYPNTMQAKLKSKARGRRGKSYSSIWPMFLQDRSLSTDVPPHSRPYSKAAVEMELPVQGVSFKKAMNK
jgi:hypothetical protein